MSKSLAPRRRWLKIVAAVAALALTIAACGGGDDDNGADGAEGDTGESADARQGGDITYAVEGDTLNFCLPTSQLAISGIMIATAVYDTLVAQNADGEIVPFLAESVEANEAGDVYTITLPDGVQFHNGEPFNAEAVVMNLNAYRGAVVAPDVNDGAPYPSTLFKILFNVNTEGLAQVDTNPEANLGIESVEAIDERTVEVRMHEPWADFTSFLYATSRIGMLAPEQLRLPSNAGCQTTMIGTGPFKHANPGEVREPRLERNEDYWREDSEGNQLPYLDSVQFIIQPDPFQRVNGIQGGEFDLTHLSGGEEIGQATSLSDSGQAYTYVQEPGYREIGHLLLNSGKAPFDNADARRAVFLAANRDQVTDIRNQGLFTVSSGLFDEAVGGNLPLDDDSLPDDSDRDAAVEEARQLAQTYEDDTGSPLTFEALTTNAAGNTQTLELLQQNLAEAGIEMTISAPVLQSEIINRAVGGALGTGLEDAPAAFLWRNHPGGVCSAQYVWFLSGWPTNFGIIDDPEVDRLFLEARQAFDEDERDDLCRQVNEYMNEQVYVGWTWWVDWTIATGTDVNGVWGPALPDGSSPPDNLSGLHRLDGIWLSD